MRLKTPMLIMAFLVSFLSFTSCNDNENREVDVEEDLQTEAPDAMEQDFNDEIDDVVVTVERNPELGTFAAKMNYVDALDTLETEQKFTIFAPNNAAYSTVFKEHGENYFDPDNEAVIMYHIVEGDYPIDVIKERIKSGNGKFSLTTLQGEEITFSLEGNKLTLTGATGNSASIVKSNIEAENGVVHIIDVVLLPYKIEEKVVI